MKIVNVLLFMILSVLNGWSQLSVSAGPRGLTTLSDTSTNFLLTGKTLPVLSQVSMVTAAGVHTAGSIRPVRTTTTGNTILVDYNWGSIATSYLAAGSKLQINTVVTNNLTVQSIDHLMFFPIGLRLPSAPKQNPGTNMRFNMDAPSSVFFDYTSGVVDLVNDDVIRPLAVSFHPNTSPAASTWQVMIYTNYAVGMGNWPPVVRTIAPGTSDTFTVSLRFGKAGVTEHQLAGDVFQKFAIQYPVSRPAYVNRPIAMLSMTGKHRPLLATNPRGWFNDIKVDTMTPSGVAALQKRMLAYADGAILEMKRVGAQGGILWDLEGQETPASYIGDPSQMETMAPELLGVLDIFVSKFTTAGLKIGFTIRPQVFDKKTLTQNEVPNKEAVLRSKIQYAVTRWGASLFYVDSDLMPDGTVNDAAIFQHLAVSFPGVLIFPEWKNTKHYAYSLPYVDSMRGVYGPSSADLAAYPNAVALVKVTDPSASSHAPELAAGVKAGNSILLFDGWYRHSANDVVSQIYKGLP